MKKLKLENLIIGAFLITALVLFTWFNMTKPRILVLQSYDKNYAWVRDMDVALKRVLDSEYEYQVHWYYMDTKRHPTREYKESAGIAARRVVEKMQPDVLIAFDDDAQKYAAKYFINDPKIKIVFAGVNNRASDYGYDKANNATGILERIPLGAMREAFQIAGNFRNLGHPVRLAMLADNSDSVSGDIRQVQSFNWSPVELTTVRRVGTWDDWKKSVVELGDKVDVILVTGYRKLSRSGAGPALVPAREVVKWTEAHSKVPVISGNGFYPEDGGMLAIGTSPYEQGEVAGQMALDIILHGKAPSDIPMQSAQQFIVTMSGSKMKARGFELPKVYEAAARTGDKYFP